MADKPNDRLLNALLGLSDENKLRTPRLSTLLTPPPIPSPPAISSLAELLKLAKAPKRKVFISYHHGNDQWAYDYLSEKYGEDLELFYDQSLDGKIRSNDPEYVNRAIREDYIVGSSITIVLCGSETWKRKCVDWEIRSTLHHDHALLGLVLHSATKHLDGKTIIPDRLYDNWVTGYAHVVDLSSIGDAATLKAVIEAAIAKSKNTVAIVNSREKMGRNIS